MFQRRRAARRFVPLLGRAVGAARFMGVDGARRRAHASVVTTPILPLEAAHRGTTQDVQRRLSLAQTSQGATIVRTIPTTIVDGAQRQGSVSMRGGPVRTGSRTTTTAPPAPRTTPHAQHVLRRDACTVMATACTAAQTGPTTDPAVAQDTTTALAPQLWIDVRRITPHARTASRTVGARTAWAPARARPMRHPAEPRLLTAPPLVPQAARPMGPAVGVARPLAVGGARRQAHASVVTTTRRHRAAARRGTTCPAQRPLCRARIS